MENQNQQKDGLSDEQKRERQLKHQHGVVYRIEVPTDDEGKDVAVGYIKKPDRQILSVVMAKIENDPMGALEIFLNSCWIEGDERIKNEDDVFLGACVALQDIIKVRQGALKKI